MKNLITILLVFLTIMGVAQTKVELNVEKNDDSEQYKVKLEQMVNGEKVVTEKTYSSLEEMKNDPDLKDVDIKFIDNGENNFSFSNDESGKQVHVVIDKDLKEGDHNMVFISDGNGDDENVDVKVWADEDGTTHMLKNGKEVDLDELHKSGDNVFVFKTDSEEGDSITENMNVKVWVDDNGEHHVMVNGKEEDYAKWNDEHKGEMNLGSKVFEFNTDDGKHIKKEIIINKEDDSNSDGDKKIEVVVTESSDLVVHIDDLNLEDAKAFSLDKGKELKLDEFNFYPNPSNGSFNLKFKGKNRPTLIRVTDINGKEIYTEDLKSFEGTYDNEIDLSGAKKGIYLLQVVQNGKAVNKKIVIE